MKQLIDIVFLRNKTSLRIIDYLCTNYSKMNNVVYTLKGKPFNLYLMYRGQLKAYSKMQFDPFRRHERITIACDMLTPKCKLTTTIAQLNFFKWAIEHNVLEYLLKNKTKIENNMSNKETPGIKKTNATSHAKINLNISFN